jgi:hypothetical protein
MHYCVPREAIYPNMTHVIAKAEDIQMDLPSFDYYTEIKLPEAPPLFRLFFDPS